MEEIPGAVRQGVGGLLRLPVEKAIDMVEGQHILVLEDHHDTAELYCELLSVEGYRVSTAETAQLAAQVVAKDVPDLLILDLDLPDQSGVDFLRTLRTDFPNLPVVVVTGSNRSTWRI